MLATAVVSLPTTVGAAIYTHSWDTVSDVMGMHGKFNQDTFPSDDTLGFVAKNYPGMATIGTGCGKTTNTTMEDASIIAAKKIKAVNAKANVGMYFRSDEALELAQCSNHSNEWNSHPEVWEEERIRVLVKKIVVAEGEESKKM